MEQSQGNSSTNKVLLRLRKPPWDNDLERTVDKKEVDRKTESRPLA